MSKAQYFSSGSLSTFLKFSLGYTSFSDQSLFWHLYIRMVSYVCLWMAVMEFLITSLQPMGSKASALPTWDGQGQSTLIQTVGFNNKSNPGINALPLACLHAHFLPKESFSEVRRKAGGHQHMHLEHIFPHSASIRSSELVVISQSYTSVRKQRAD